MARSSRAAGRHGVLHADHDGGRRGSRVPRRDAQGAHPRRAGRRRVGDPRRLKAVYKDFNLAGDALVARLQTFRDHGVHVLGSFIFGLPTDRADDVRATAALAQRADVTFAQFVLLTPFPGTVDFEKWEDSQARARPSVDGIPLTRHWLIPPTRGPKIYTPHPTMSLDEIRAAHAGGLGPLLQPAARSGERSSVRASR